MGRWKRLGLRSQIFITLAALVFITIGGGLIMIWYTYQMESLITSVIQTDVASLQAAKGLEIALLNQRGYVSYYLLENDPDWLKELGRYRAVFEEKLKEARKIDSARVHHDFLDRIESEYRQYIKAKDHVIQLYKSGNHEEGSKLHRDVRDHFFKILDTCDEHIRVHNEKLKKTWAMSHIQAKRLRLVAGSALSAAIAVGALLAFVLLTQVLEPIRRLASEADLAGDSDSSDDDVTMLADRVHHLIDDMGQTQTELQRSRERLLQSEKMATVGKLAAEVAHSIRNPMTSIKMRLFSLERALDLSSTQQEDLEVISDEIRQVDNIVQNFLEFSRPPKLKVQSVNVSEIIDMAVRLLEKRFERHGVRLERQTGEKLPAIKADPELLKEVVVNLIVNACDAMEDGGRLVISEKEAVAEHLGRAVLVRLSDTGPGIPPEIQEKIMEPFFSTKEEGTGLGLAIAARIIEEHGGKLGLKSEVGKGTTFTITLPVPEDEA